MSINSVTLVGNLGRDPEIRRTNSDIPVARFSIAADRQYTSKGERITDWIDCEAWRQTADFVGKYFHKGDSIGVVGTLQTQKWTDNDGKNRQRMYVNVTSVSFVGNKNSVQNSAAPVSGGDFGNSQFSELPDLPNYTEPPF